MRVFFKCLFVEVDIMYMYNKLSQDISPSGFENVRKGAYVNELVVIPFPANTRPSRR
jgi:hypothetical protein